MSIADKSLTIDVWGSITSLSLIQGESNGRKLIYTITDKGEPLDLTGKSVRLFVVKPDGAIVYTDCEIETAAEGKVSFVVSSQMVVTAGLGSGELHIRNAEDDLLKTPKISILVEPSHNVDEAVESSNEFDVLTELINSIDFRTLSRVFSAGRPDKPETTEFTAEELAAMPIGTEFVSSDGANVGAWVWTKFGREDEPSTPATAKGWTVTSGDTGNVLVTPTNVTGGAKIVFRRVNNTIFSSLGFQGPWGTFGIDENAIALEGTKFNLGVVPQGFGTNIAQTMLLSRDGKEMITDAVYNVLNRTPDGGKIQIRCKDATTANGLKGQDLLRAASIRWVTNEPWPESL
jgi:hypothetical protein